MDDIYVIIRGEYSDWSIQGYTTRKSEAKRMCAILRSKDKSKYPDRFYYQKIKHLLTPDEVRNRILYSREVWFKKSEETGGYEILNDRHHNSNNVKFYLDTDIHRKLGEDDGIGITPSGIIRITVETHENDRKKAEKIAQDRIYKYLAEQNGIG